MSSFVQEACGSLASNTPNLWIRLVCHNNQVQKNTTVYSADLLLWMYVCASAGNDGYIYIYICSLSKVYSAVWHQGKVGNHSAEDCGRLAHDARLELLSKYQYDVTLYHTMALLQNCMMQTMWPYDETSNHLRWIYIYIIILYYIISYYIILCYIISYYIILCYAILYLIISNYII